jgi:hypothetical protein
VKKKVLAIVLSVIAIGLVMASSPQENGCDHPSPQQLPHCQELEQEILSATVRIQLHGWVEIEDAYASQRINGTLSHATVIDGRYLVSHNHFGIPLSKVVRYSRYGNGSLTGVSVYKTNGEPVLSNAPITAFSVVSEVGETTWLDFGLVDGQGLFARAGLTRK